MRIRRRPSPLVQFAALSALLLLVVGAVLSQRLTDAIRTRTLDDAARTAEIAANLGVKPLLEPDDVVRDFLPLGPERRRALDEHFGASLSANGVVRIKLWNRQHWLVWSDNPGLQGRWFPGNERLARAFRGEVTSEITDLSAPEELEERDFGELLAVYVPLRLDASGTAFGTDESGPVVGAFEIYLPYAPIAAGIAHDRRELLAALVGGLALLWAALFETYHGASRRLRRQARENEHQALHDQLTGLPNRRALYQRLGELLDGGRRDGTGVAVLLCDLNRFKDINDTLGHQAGDDLLVQIGPRLRSVLRAEDTVVRLGGDEFVVAIAGLGRASDARTVVDTISGALAAPFPIDGLHVDVHAAIGVAVFPDDADDPETLLRHADVAMYVAKRTQAVSATYAPEIDQYSKDRLALAAELRDGIACGDVRLHYQPKIDLRTGGVAGVEALVRWDHPTRGRVNPAEFVGVVENTELVLVLTNHLVDVAIAQVAAWQRAGLCIPVAVNIAARNAGDPGLPDVVARSLERHGVDASMLELELTESAILQTPASVRDVLARLRALGVTIAVDDFGTGYASISYLTDLPVTTLKIDQRFVGTMRADAADEAVVRFSTGLAASFGLKTVAEGVEDAATAEALADLGVDVAQGYHFSRPVPADELEQFARRVGTAPALSGVPA